MFKKSSAIWWLIITLILLTLVSIGIGIINGGSTKRFDKQLQEYLHSSSKLEQPQDGKDAEVNYDAIFEYVRQQVASIPAPVDGKNGNNGTNGANGLNGVDGSSCTTKQLEDGAAILCTDGTTAVIKNGQNGAQGEAGPTPYFRCNENKNRWEIRYSVDENWAILNNKATPCKAGGLLQ